MVACFTNIFLTRIFGVEGVLGVGAGLQGLGSLIVAASVSPVFEGLGWWEWSFGVVVLGFGIAGFGLAVQDAAYNTFVSRLEGKEGKLGVLHAVYGVGALISPVFVLLFMKDVGAEKPPVWFLSNAGWCLVVILILVSGIVVDKRTSNDPGSAEVGYLVEDEEEGEDGVGEVKEREIVGLREVVRHKMVWTTLLFIALYTGSETTESSWIITFLLRERPKNPLSHYASTAFYTGVTSSRVLLLPITTYLTPRLAIFAYIFLALLSQILVIVVGMVEVDLVAIGAAGFVMGPVYPVTVGLLTSGVKREFQTGALSAMGLMARAGSAGFPFLVGVLADKVGVKVLPGVMVGLFLGMGGAWGLVPFGGKGGEDGVAVEGVDVIEDDEECV